MALLLAVICLLTLESFSYAYRLRNGAVVRFGRKFSLLSTAGSQDSDTILRQVKNWACVKSCGACCKLGPIEDRPDLGDYLSPEEYEKYVSMIGPDNWCKHYDQTNRLCTIYDDRPAFCRVEVNKFKDMYDIKEDEFSVSSCVLTDVIIFV